MTATLTLRAPLEGWCMPLAATPDPVFSAGMMGDGIALDPTGGELVAPFAGEVVAMPASGHAVSLRSTAGIEVLIHVGIDTVALDGRGFTPHVAAGQKVAVGESLLSVDLDLVARNAPSLVTPIVITNLASHTIQFRHEPGAVRAGDVLLTLAADGASGYSAVAAVAAAGGKRREACLTIALAHGLHARPAALIAQSLKGLAAEVELVVGERRANARSVVSIMALGLRQGDELRVVALGREAEAALVALAAGLEQARLRETGGAPAPPRSTRSAAAIAVTLAQDRAVLTGAIAAPGFAIGQATRLARQEIAVTRVGQGVAHERAELERARSLVSARLTQIAQANAGARGDIVAAHLEFLSDPMLEAAAQRAIGAGQSAGFAWRAAIGESVAALATLDDERLRERIDDLRDIEAQVLLALGAAAAPMSTQLPHGAVLIAEALLPSELVALDRDRLAAVCLVGGGTTSHVAILAAAMNLPMLVGLGARLAEIADGATLIVDADQGRLELRPDAAAVTAAEQRVRRSAARSAAQRNAAQRECRTADGIRIEVFANVGSEADAQAAVVNGAEGCGLLRTEFLFLERSAPPSDDEQRAAYQAIADALAPRPMVLRLLDVGGDKTLSYLPMPAEDNPTLGLRGIRTGLARPELLRTQLRAALGVSGEQLRLLVPMVTEVAELRQVRALVGEIAQQLGRSGPVPIGAMIETPAAAATSQQLATEADFLSIGSNDLTQYTLAMDRGHPGLATRVDALHPAVLTLIGLAAAGAGRCQLAVCGAMAADPLAVPLLLGLGVTELSVVPARVPAVKELIGRLVLGQCAEIARAALTLEHAPAVRALVTTWFSQRAIVLGGE
jgi:phosphoenolpyruvate-protein phosphotransferase